MLLVLLESSSALSTPPRPLGTALQEARETHAQKLGVVGEVPKWLRGAYLRNGPGRWADAKHLFDGFALLGRIEIPEMTLKTKYLQSEAYRFEERTGERLFGEFGTGLNPKALLRSFFYGGPATDNACVSVLKADGRYFACTETVKGTYEINAETLETLGRSKQKGGVIQTAHALKHGNSFVNIGTTFFNRGRPGYEIFKLTNFTDRNDIAFVPSRTLDVAWIHAHAVTEDYVVFFETPAVYDIGSLLRGGNIAFHWKPERGTWLHVVHLKTGKTQRFPVAENFFLFHCANAYVEDSILNVDVCLFDDAKIINGLLLKNMGNASHDIPQGRLSRISTNLLNAGGIAQVRRLDNRQGSGDFAEFAHINEAFTGRNYEWAYALGARRPTSAANVVTKTNVRAGTTVRFQSELSYVAMSEPTFVKRPKGSKEDSGVVLTIGHTPEGEAHLLIFDARTTKELARIVVPKPGLPYCFHALWDPAEEEQAS